MLMLNFDNVPSVTQKPLEKVEFEEFIHDDSPKINRAIALA